MVSEIPETILAPSALSAGTVAAISTVCLCVNCCHNCGRRRRWRFNVQHSTLSSRRTDLWRKFSLADLTGSPTENSERSHSGLMVLVYLPADACSASAPLLSLLPLFVVYDLCSGYPGIFRQRWRDVSRL
ncbi:hypothetical protein GALMADRAFT_1246759 [Galerina marginata CBS 339.88]|uniref:Uncharacterized protein n=1 Tax=Galerina marginata (strain CBS 339.88) TaxID=685588 RepID=A0A067T926_GALM3|nr:hypothetical protein GALMADRAFT_1246759 [Galerina marginata CBS 339.88]